MTDLDRATRGAYDAAAPAWVTGPEHVYRPLAAAVLDSSPLPLLEVLLIDIGCGSGVLGDIATQRGAHCIETDVAVEMLAHRRNRSRHGVASDGRRLPFRDGSFDLVTAACSLSHIPDPVHMVAESRRVLHAEGALLASTFPPATQAHPVRDIVETTLVAVGYVRPPWYQQLKVNGEPQVETAAALLDLASQAKFATAEVIQTCVDTGISSPGALVDWRLGMAQYADFISALDDRNRRGIRATAMARLGQAPPRLLVELNVLIARQD